MKRKAKLNLIEQSDKVSIYSISFSLDNKTEFERFMDKFETIASLNKDYQKILYAIQLILDRGALERYFRPEGKMSDNLCALPIESGKIRLYCLRISDEILILGNGGIKNAAKYQEDNVLLGYTADLQKFDKLIKEEIKSGSIIIEEHELKGIDKRTFEI